MSTWNLLWAMRKQFIPSICSFAILIAAGYLYAGPESGHLFLGLALVTFIQAIYYARKNVEFWPVMERIVDWDKVEKLAKTDSADGAS